MLSFIQMWTDLKSVLLKCMKNLLLIYHYHDCFQAFKSKVWLLK